MSSISGRCNSNERGSSYDRRARRAWLLSPAAGFGGDGDKVPCWECGAMVNDRTLICDRIVPGEFGGRYTRGNIRPHCQTCSCRQGNRRTQELRGSAPPGSIWADPYDDTDHCKGCGRHFLGEHVFGCVWITEHDEVSTPVGRLDPVPRLPAWTRLFSLDRETPCDPSASTPGATSTRP